MANSLKITVLIENTAARSGLCTEHGLSYWIECDGHSLLFDTGQSASFRDNAARLGIDPISAESIVLSHGHYDHTGGLPVALALAPRATLYLHPDALAVKFSRSRGGRIRDIGIPAESRSAIAAHRAPVVHTLGPTLVAPGLYATGPIPRTNDFEDTGGSFFLDSAGTAADPLLDDQALFANTASGVIVLLGCAHAGVINTIQYVRQLCGPAPLRAVLGGMHLINASPRRMEATIRALAEHPRLQLAPAHCTGAAPVESLRAAFPTRVMDCRAGNTFVFDDATEEILDNP